MKKIALTVLFSLVICSIYSQSLLGIRGGFDITSLSSGDSESRAGFNIGAMYMTPISEKWYFQPSLLFGLNGSKASDSYKPDYSAYFYSLEVPLVLSYRAGNEDVSIGLDVGPYFRYGLFGSYWTDSDSGRIKPDIFESHKRFDLGPQVGFSVIVSGLYIGYSFQYGILKPWDDKRGNYFKSSLNIGYLFQLL